jgi:hypothetical protein
MSYTNYLALPILGSSMTLCWACKSKVEPNQQANVRSRIQRSVCWCRTVNPPMLHPPSGSRTTRQLWNPSIVHRDLLRSLRLTQAGAPILKCMLYLYYYYTHATYIWVIIICWYYYFSCAVALNLPLSYKCNL